MSVVVVGATVSVGVVGRGRGRGRGGVYPDGKPVAASGKEPATLPGGSVEVVVAVPGSVNAVVVSTFVPVTVEVVSGGAVSPGPLIVEVTAPSAEPSCTTSYCCWSRCILPLRLHEAAARMRRIAANCLGCISTQNRTLYANGKRLLRESIPLWYSFGP
jgi:hypothetical protein